MKVNQEFEKSFGTKLNQVSWNNSTPIDKDWEELKNKYGFSSVCYGGARDFLKHINKFQILQFYLDIWVNCIETWMFGKKKV